ncbi:hypothetical protein [Micromonospora tulbaghiae]|uniref:hypothetical protein n=1 Tax=Micromonospora tulbaghiae TaxID=479978 RepID=UPI0033B34FDD
MGSRGASVEAVFLRPLPAVFDRFAVTKAFLDRKSAESGIPVRFQDAFEVIEPFAR